MKDRIRQLMLDKNMTQKTLASELCIAEATLSGIFNGRTRPTTLTVNAIHERFPEVNISWLMFGEGSMYTDSNMPQSLFPGEEPAPSDAVDNAREVAALSSGMAVSEASPTLFDDGMRPATFASHAIVNKRPENIGSPQTQCQPQIQYIEKYIDKPVRKITEIRIFFDDGTYETFTP